MILWLLLGGVFTTMYITMSLGLYKFWYITRSAGTVFHPNMLYASLPFGLAGLYAALMPFLPNYSPDSFYLWVYIGLTLLGVVFMTWTPHFLKPRWVKLLEYDYGYCLPILMEEARKMGRWKWNAHVRTPAQLQTWLDQTLTHRQTDIDPLWQEYHRHMQRKHGKGNFHIPQHRRKQ